MGLLQDHDALLLDLDGTVWEGGRAIPGAVETITESGLRTLYITNNASRSPAVVASMLRDIDLDAHDSDIITSAQAAIWMMEEECERGATVLVLGSDSFKDLVREAGYRVVDTAEEDPVAVLQGHSTETGWRELSEAALAIRAGARYFASNLDTSLPMERGLMVGNGAMVAAIECSTGVSPQSAGKPQPTMFLQGAERAGAKRPLAVGDRLDTDIEGGVAAEMDVLHVMTGVSGPQDLLRAPATRRPTFLAKDFTEAWNDAETLRPGPQGGFQAERSGDTITLSGGDESSTFMQAVRTVLGAAWESEDTAELSVEAQGDVAQAVVKEWW
ncbi:HAD-IIA family hydrolase [Corynebacterium uropygiale]|uniref:HAD-IIA family hydrolase n=1 Tax=Corynebacterium uropygiale TaxID=1775911 RepID=A0A9X1QR88_9CORY|nr:HAD-IIA family hydrolase [Corynebacterium uropygiale]MCF4006715.1 HAD-IIA family hydrolase [Corynebacterium uropygiale]